MDSKQLSPEQQKKVRKAKAILWIGIIVIIAGGLIVAIILIL